MSMHLWIIPLLPLAGAAINGLLGKRFPKALVNAIALGFTAAAFAMALWVAAQFFSLPPDQIVVSCPSNKILPTSDGSGSS